MQIDLSQFHQIFRGEAEMLLARIDASLCSLKPERADPALTGMVLRSAHTLKGAAAASQARDPLTRFAAPGVREAGALPEAVSGASVRCQEALR